MSTEVYILNPASSTLSSMKLNPTIKIIHQKEKKSKHKYTRKKPSKIKNIKDINDIEKKIEQSKKNEKVKSDIKRSLVKRLMNVSR